MASSVLVDYVSFLKRCLEQNEGIRVEEVFFYDEFTYRRFSRGSKFRRLQLRAGMYIGYPLSLFWRLLRGRSGSLWIITSNTFFAPLIGLLSKSIKRYKIMYLMYDLFPDAMDLSSESRIDRLANHILGLITRYQLRNADATVFLGRHLKDYAESRYGSSNISRVIDIGADESIHLARDVTIKPSDIIEVHYGGQFGELHDLNTMIDGIKCCRELTHICFSFAISGSKAEIVEKRLANEPNCRVGPAVPSSVWRENTLKYHVGVVTLSPKGMNICLPSKTYSMMAASMAILAICPLDSDLAGLVQSSNCGWIVELGDTHGFVNVVNEIWSNPQLVADYRANARKAVEDLYGIGACSQKWRELFSALGQVS
ncbi:MAG: hypothetical protein JRI43_00960 [Deltaproteobacteria bacterium]|nr:hypothetical protein [Deltaproteobacteria bacterium]